MMTRPAWSLESGHSIHHYWGWIIFVCEPELQLQRAEVDCALLLLAEISLTEPGEIKLRLLVTKLGSLQPGWTRGEKAANTHKHHHHHQFIFLRYNV